MLLHRMARYAMRTARAQHVSRREDLRPAAVFEHHPQAVRVFVDGLHFRAVFDLDAQASQMFAQDRLGLPLRQAALKLIFAPDISEFHRRDLLQARAQQLNLPDAHARAKERLDQTGPVDNLEHGRLQGGPARLVMRREPALDDARLDAMANKLAGREQSGRAAPHDQDGRFGCGRTILTRIQQPDIPQWTAHSSVAQGTVVAAAGILQCWRADPAVGRAREYR